MLVSEYSVERCYGGPEEGGWWYDYATFERVRGFGLPEDDAYALAHYMNDRERELRDGPDRFSVLGDVDIAYQVEALAGENATTERPRYE